MPFQPKPIGPPWTGVVDNLPSILAPNSSFASSTGFWIEKQRLRSALARSPLPGGPIGPFVGQRSFLDAVGNIHTVVMTGGPAGNLIYYYANGVFTLVSVVSGFPSLQPAKMEVYQNTLICTNGTGTPIVIDGSANASTIALPNNGTCFFLGKLAGRMLYLYMVEPKTGQPGSSGYPRRFRWSMINNANNFTDFTSGVADIPEIDGNITGYAVQGALGYIYNNRGITVVTPTGGISPAFYLEPYTEGRGLGNFYPYSLAQYGNLTIFAGEGDIYVFNPLLGPPQPMGGTAARSIYNDLAQTDGIVIGSLTPTFSNGQQGLVYWLAIPLQTGSGGSLTLSTKVWQYIFDTQTWASQTYPFAVTTIEVIAVS